ncbi:MAG: hypothetical protein AAF639_32440 [Chloroflexota bacterium]
MAQKILYGYVGMVEGEGEDQTYNPTALYADSGGFELRKVGEGEFQILFDEKFDTVPAVTVSSRTHLYDGPFSFSIHAPWDDFGDPPTLHDSEEAPIFQYHYIAASLQGIDQRECKIVTYIRHSTVGSFTQQGIQMSTYQELEGYSDGPFYFTIIGEVS